MKGIFKDSAILGIIAGIVGNIPKTIITRLFQELGWTRYNFGQIAAGFFVNKENIAELIAVIVGYIADFTIAVSLGIVSVYIMRLMGKDYAIIKGIAFGMISYVFIYGIAMALDFTRVSLLTPLPNLVLLFPHLVLGVVISWFIEHYGDLEQQT